MGKELEKLMIGYQEVQKYKYVTPGITFAEEVAGEEAARSGLIKVDFGRAIYTADDVGTRVAMASLHLQVLDEYYVRVLDIGSYQQIIEDSSRALKYEEEAIDELSADATEAKSEEALYRINKRMKACKQRIRELNDTIFVAQKTLKKLTDDLNEEKDVAVESRDRRIRAFLAGATHALGSELPEVDMNELMKYYGASEHRATHYNICGNAVAEEDNRL